MAILSVSQIQHRRGLRQDLPQLASGEFGWAINTRQLFIGNGTAEEGAPEIGNTEILTKYSNVMEFLTTYTYKGAAGGYTVVTGPDANSPVVRTIQAKFDDIANVKDFGAVGDGSTDDTAAINRALYQLFCAGLNTAVRRILYFPAGVYIVTDALLIPTYATLIGDGLNDTIIKRADINAITSVSDNHCVGKLVDNLQQYDLNNGTGSGVSSRYIDIRDMTFALDRPTITTPDGSTIVDLDIFEMNYGQKVRFARVGFNGYRTLDSDIGGVEDSRAGLKLNYIGAEATIFDILFENCEFSNTTYAITADENVNHVTFRNCNFNHLYRGAIIGSSSSIYFPRNIAFHDCYWDKIYDRAIDSAANCYDITSSFCRYRDVGMALLGESYPTPISDVINFQEESCVSFCDSFSRSSTAEDVYAVISYNDKSILVYRPRIGLSYGYVTTEPSGATTLTDNTASPTSTGVSLNINTTNGAEVIYQIIRTNQIRQGKVRIAHDISNQSFMEDYVENNGDIGVSFNLSFSGNVTTLTYTTTSTGNDASLHYQTKYVS